MKTSSSASSTIRVARRTIASSRGMGTSLKTAGVSTLTSTFVRARMAAPPVDESHMSSARIWMVKRGGIGVLGGLGEAPGPRCGPTRAAARTTSLTRLRAR